MKDELLLAAVRRVRDKGMTWDDFVAICAPEFGAVMREGRVDGWVPVPRPWPYDAKKAHEALHGKKRAR